MKSSFGLLSCN